MALTRAEAIEALEAVREKRGWFIALGVILIFIGTAAIVFPFLTTLTAELLVGWVLVFGGVAQIVHAFGRKTGAALVTSEYECRPRQLKLNVR